MKLARFASAPYYPFLIAALPVLHFYQKDFGAVAAWQVLRLLLVYWVIIALLLVVLRRMWRDPTRGELLCGACAAPLFYGGSLEWPRLALVLVAILGLGVALKKWSVSLRRWIPVVNIGCAALALFPIVSTLNAQRTAAPPRPKAGYDAALSLPVVSGDELPDIYFILADGLGHPSILESIYDVPAQTFGAPLRDVGFHIVPGSRSNYAQTAQSLGSTLNMEYVQDLLFVPDPTNTMRHPLATLIARNRVVNTLRVVGYRVVTMPAEYDLSQLQEADERRRPFFAPGFFELHTVRSSLLPHVQRLFGRGPADLEFALHRRRIEFVLRELRDARRGAAPNEPVMVYAHIIAPHPPFVYGRHGERLRSRQKFGFADGDHWLFERHGDRDDYVRQYRDQALYIVEQLASTVGAIIQNASRPLVIVVQGDHGPGSQLFWGDLRHTNMVERHAIFNAWFASNPERSSPPDGTTSVNTFRFLFNEHFGASLPLLEDRAWFSRWLWPYIFYEAPAP